MDDNRYKLVAGAAGAAICLWVFGFAGTLALGAAFGAGALWASDGTGRYVEQAKEHARVTARDDT